MASGKHIFYYAVLVLQVVGGFIALKSYSTLQLVTCILGVVVCWLAYLDSDKILHHERDDRQGQDRLIVQAILANAVKRTIPKRKGGK